MTEDPTWEETLDGLLHPRPPGFIVFFVEVGIGLLELVPVVFQTLVEGGVFRLAGPVGASEGHALSETFAGANLPGPNRIHDLWPSLRCPLNDERWPSSGGDGPGQWLCQMVVLIHCQPKVVKLATEQFDDVGFPL